MEKTMNVEVVFEKTNKETEKARLNAYMSAVKELKEKKQRKENN